MKQSRKLVRISELTRLARTAVEGAFHGGIWVIGEIRQFKVHTSGHWYFVLRDDNAQVDCVMWRSDNAGLGWLPTDGMEVEAHVFPTVFERAGRFQLKTVSMLPAGKGSRAVAFEILKKKLAAEGIFDSFHKKKLPLFPLVIGVATSRTGAAIKDIVNVLRRRAPWITVILRNTRVQGEGAANDIIQAIEEFNAFEKIDLLIVGRGGGSEEDLWCFNDERVARAIFDSDLPIISAVGHEIDFTISDFAADIRAATPSAAAEIAAPDRKDLAARLAALLRTTANALMGTVLRNRAALQNMRHRLAMENPIRKTEEMRQRVDMLDSSTRKGISILMERKSSALNHIIESLRILSPDRILARGFSIATHDGKIVSNVAEIRKGDLINIRFFKGVAETLVEKVIPGDEDDE